MIFNLIQSRVDIIKLSSLNSQLFKGRKKKIDYSKYIINKPWGYEYLIYQNELCAVWILYIKKGHQTSMHCHLTKKTSITVLGGQVQVVTLKSKLTLDPGEGVLIEKGVFHLTSAITEDVVVMEVETPNVKHDLVRLYDSYGRENFGYEGRKFYENIDYSTYESFHNNIFNSLKKFGEKHLKLVDCVHIAHLFRSFDDLEVEVACLLAGQITNSDKAKSWIQGDLIDFLKLKGHFSIDNPIQVMLIGKSKV